MMRNKYEFKDDYGVMYIRFKDCIYKCLLDTEDLLHLIDLGISWNGHTGKSDDVYVRGTLPAVNGKRKSVMLHRYLLNAPEKLYVDHINRNPLDNRRSNLNLVDTIASAQNKGMYSNNTSGYKGVRKQKDKDVWIASIRFKGRNIVKYTKTKEDAIKAVEDLKREYHLYYMEVVKE